MVEKYQFDNVKKEYKYSHFKTKRRMEVTQEQTTNP